MNRNNFKEAVQIMLQTKELKTAKEELEGYKETIQNGKEYIIHLSNKIIKTQAEIDAFLVVDETMEATFTNQIEDIKALPNVLDVWIETEGTKVSLCLSVDELNCIASDGGEFFINPTTTRIELLTSRVRIKNTNGDDDGFRGHWTSYDPHPHVNGADGAPCLGNIDGSIVEYIAAKDYYSLSLLMLEWLQSANHEDSAGKYYTKFRKED